MNDHFYEESTTCLNADQQRKGNSITLCTVPVYIKCDGHTKVWWSVPKSDGFVPIRMWKSNDNRITTFVPSCHDGVMENVKLAIQSQQDGSISLYGRSIHDTFWQSEGKERQTILFWRIFFHLKRDAKKMQIKGIELVIFWW